jgi:NIMA (never in mitosis gene a)-related kinase
MNDFQIINKLGEGAYSMVYKVKRIIDNQIYALKKVKLLNLSEKEKENSLNEVRILASVKSNFVVSYKEAFFDEKDNTLCLVMEFADNGDLYQKIVSHKKSANFMEESDIWRIFIQLVKGLKALHDLKILHRDMKSANVFLFSNGCAKLGDLNVSKVARRGLGYTQTGTPYYASPEVWKDKPYDHKSDVWSLGCVLYEMITLRPPFRAKDMEGLFNKVCKGEINKIPEKFSDDLFQIVKYLLQVNSIQRPSCDQILQHPIILKRIEYFKSFGSEDDTEDKCLLKTIHMPKNLLFLSDKLPKPNYDKKFKNINNTNKSFNEENKNYRSFNKMGNLVNNINDYMHKNKNINLNINENNISLNNSIKSGIKLKPINNLENYKQDLLSNRNNSYILNIKNKILNSSSNNNNNLIINKSINNIKKDEMYYKNIISRQKNDIRNLILKNNSIIKKINSIHNSNNRLDLSSIKDVSQILMPNINSKSIPMKKKSYKLIKNKYQLYNLPYYKGYQNIQKNSNNLNYDYGILYKSNNNSSNKSKEFLPKIPKKLSPIKKLI